MSACPFQAVRHWSPNSCGKGPLPPSAHSEAHDVDSALTNKLMLRVTNYFDTQIRIPVAGDPSQTPTMRDSKSPPMQNGNGSTTFEAHMNPTTNKGMSDEQRVSWYSKVLDGVKQRHRKLQRLAR